MKKRTITIVVAGLLIIFMLASLVAPLMSKKQTENNTIDNTENNTDKKTENNSDNTDDDGTAFSSGNNGGGWYNPDYPSDNSDDNTSQSKSDNQDSSENLPDIPTISFPYAIGGSDLVIERVGSYEGYFVEDGSDREVSGIATIVLKNNGDDLRFTGIGISQGTRSLAFVGSLIPAGATIIIQEQNGAEYSKDPYYSATATTDYVDSFEMSKEFVSVKDNGKNGFVVTNKSGKTLSSVKVFFKNYLSDGDVYVGGIAYSVQLNDVEPDTSTEVTATHYDSIYSVILEVKVEQ